MTPLLLTVATMMSWVKCLAMKPLYLKKIMLSKSSTDAGFNEVSGKHDRGEGDSLTKMSETETFFSVN